MIPTGPQLIRAARRVIRWSGPVACLLLIFREYASLQWTNVVGGTWVTAGGQWPGPTLWTALFILLAILTIAEWIALTYTAMTRPLDLRRCLKCNYNLRGLPPNSPCPECGHAQEP